MTNKNTIEINLSDAIALCYIKNDFEEFNKKLIEFFKETINHGNSIYELGKISSGEKMLFSKKVKKFFNENRETISKINMHSSIEPFIYNNYNFFEEPENLQFENYKFFQYIQDNKEQMVKIFLVLYKLKELGFKTILFNEKLDFTKKEYKVSATHNFEEPVEIVDNIEAIPGYEKNTLRYKTTSSAYKIHAYIDDGEIAKRLTSISLNSLTFDAKQLPNEISINEFDMIFREAFDKKRVEYQNIRSSVDLTLTTEEIYQAVNKLNDIVDNISNIHIQGDLKETFSTIKDKLMMLSILNEFYDQSLIENNQHITKNLLETEKKLSKIKKG